MGTEVAGPFRPHPQSGETKGREGARKLYCIPNLGVLVARARSLNRIGGCHLKFINEILASVMAVEDYRRFYAEEIRFVASLSSPALDS